MRRGGLIPAGGAPWEPQAVAGRLLGRGQVEEAVGSSVLGPLAAPSSGWLQPLLQPKLLLIYLPPRGA